MERAQVDLDPVITLDRRGFCRRGGGGVVGGKAVTYFVSKGSGRVVIEGTE